jgi:hypothetical protein
MSETRIRPRAEPSLATLRVWVRSGGASSHRVARLVPGLVRARGSARPTAPSDARRRRSARRPARVRRHAGTGRGARHPNRGRPVGRPGVPISRSSFDDESSDERLPRLAPLPLHAPAPGCRPFPQAGGGSRPAQGRGRTGWLLFTDAERHAPDTIGGVLARASGPGVTLLPCSRPPGRRADGSAGRCGADPLVRRPARPPRVPVASRRVSSCVPPYESVGGHEAMRHELVDDQMLAVPGRAGTLLVLAGSAEGSG